MLEHAVYSVISPEGCASILWRSSDQAKEAADALKLTAKDLLGLRVIDHIVPEPVGGAHRDPKRAVTALGEAIDQALGELEGRNGDALRRDRREKFLAMGASGAV
ncbi:MAG: acetyl-CoA carboxylase carboxyl transferase subunit alpha, partial [Dongiaceae bacterium]